MGSSFGIRDEMRRSWSHNAGTVRCYLALVFLAVQLPLGSPMNVQSHSEATLMRAPAGLTPSASQSAAPGDAIHLAWFYKPPSQVPLESLASTFDFFILTHKDEAARDRLLASGRQGQVLQYLLLAEITKPRSCSASPTGNQVAYLAGDFCRISRDHPDWFLLDQHGNRVRAADGNYYMDPGNAGYRWFWLRRAITLQTAFGWNGLFLDNVDASRAKFGQHGIALARYPNDPSYQAAVEGFLEYIEQTYSGADHKPMLANIVSVRNDAVWVRYIQHLDGAMIKSFATHYRDNALQDAPLLGAEWARQMSLAENALAAGKRLVLVAQGAKSDFQLQRFALGSYLLITNGNASFRYANANSYLQAWVYPNYGLKSWQPLRTSVSCRSYVAPRLLQWICAGKSAYRAGCNRG